jgi:hypothetical protein
MIRAPRSFSIASDAAIALLSVSARMVSEASSAPGILRSASIARICSRRQDMVAFMRSLSSAGCRPSGICVLSVLGASQSKQAAPAWARDIPYLCVKAVLLQLCSKYSRSSIRLSLLYISVRSLQEEPLWARSRPQGCLSTHSKTHSYERQAVNACFDTGDPEATIGKHECVLFDAEGMILEFQEKPLEPKSMVQSIAASCRKVPRGGREHGCSGISATVDLPTDSRVCLDVYGALLRD